ncbi:hypothetical protein C8R45DRAFT_832094, partial [Mycena sanguinolenta]
MRWKVYTDRSGIDGMIGAAAVLYLATDHMVYEGEGVGISLGLGLLWAERELKGEVTIMVDSQAAIKAMVNFMTTPSHYIWDNIHQHAATVQRKHPDSRLTIPWAPGHHDILGNERADEELKKASQEGSSPPNTIPPAYCGRVLPHSLSAREQQ